MQGILPLATASRAASRKRIRLLAVPPRSAPSEEAGVRYPGLHDPEALKGRVLPVELDAPRSRALPAEPGALGPTVQVHAVEEEPHVCQPLEGDRNLTAGTITVDQTTVRTIMQTAERVQVQRYINLTPVEGGDGRAATEGQDEILARNTALVLQQVPGRGNNPEGHEAAI